MCQACLSEGATMQSGVYALSSWIFLHVVAWQQVAGHPQCNDFRPPFSVKRGLSFCTEYSTFGCCTQKNDAEVKRRYNAISVLLDRDQLGHCKAYAKTLLCQRCSPYAAHLFDSESTGVERPLPGMCTDYCENFYDRCRQLVRHLTTDSNVLNSLSSRINFCQKNQIPDPRYCYDKILQNTDLNSEISRERRTQEGCLCLEPFASGLRNPLIMRSPPDRTDRIFVGEQVGVVHIFHRNGSKLPEPFMDFQDMVLTSGYRGDERGFLGFAFHPRYEFNGRFFVYYSIRINGRHHTKLSEFRVQSGNPNKADRNSEKMLLKINQPFANHNGGALFFGTDNYLYLFAGDGGAGGDPRNYAQNTQSLLGKALRIDVDHTDSVRNTSYRIPDDNPFARNPDFRPEIFAYGIRNIWRCDVDEGDPVTGAGRGRILCGDVGQSSYEEIDIIESGGNYGWNIREGFECFRQDLCRNTSESLLKAPIYAYRHGSGSCSVTGGHVYRGCMNPNLNGLYIYGDYCDGKLWRLKENGGRWENKKITMCGDDVCFNGLVGRYERNILSFGEDFNGEVYVLTTNNPSPTSPSGSIYRIIDPRLRGDTANCRSAGWAQPPPPPPQATPAPPSIAADVMVIIDSSGNIGYPNWKATMTFVQRMITIINPDVHGHKMGAMVFGKTPSYYSSPQDYRDTATTMNLLSSWETFTSPLAYVSSVFLNGETRGKFVILVTDRNSEQNQTQMVADSRLARSAGLKVFVVAIGGSNTFSNDIASGREFIINVNSFDALPLQSTTDAVDRMSKRIRGQSVGAGEKYQWSCDLEDTPGDPWCGMQQSNQDVFDWIRHTETTQSWFTGPEKAHAGTMYAYIEASVPRKTGDTADLIVPPVPREGAYCFRLWYFMYGHHIGRLVIFVAGNGQMVEKFKIVGQQQTSDKEPWRKLSLNLDLVSGDQIVVRGVRGTEYSGDLAVDSISIDNGTCSEDDHGLS